MADKSNVSSSVPLETPNVNPSVGLDTSAVNSLLMGEVPIVLPSVATIKRAINSLVRNMHDPVKSQYVVK
ncbi:hypothetical protein Ddye_009049 [Dipteronia dyeriana]|uniref:Uncharacterized protein n=1 Tax=Dipteronia dyeriana TaxID=168575 RepID=A0AAD9XB07_9ROSI|nr:hypothetical protein Ddye_009049 [Dipteronia dyeriana]